MTANLDAGGGTVSMAKTGTNTISTTTKMAPGPQRLLHELDIEIVYPELCTKCK